ncbi:MAG: leucine-rich repeat domain-containing protein [Blautia sp.]|nr:leucine-rich repeat domain-containing protein [Blautia sp.]
MLMAIAIAVTQLPVSDVEAEGSAADNAAENPASVSDFQVNGTTLVKYNGTSENVSVSGYVEKIEAEAFAGNESIRTVVIGDGVKSIGSGAFRGCSQLQAVTVADSVETIEQAAFADCPSLSSVQIGRGLKELGNGAFAGDISLADVGFSSRNPGFICDDGAIYSKDGESVLYALLAGRQNGYYAMPSTVSTIRTYAFWGNRNLQSVDISGNVSEISAYAFSNCCNLKLVNIPYSVRTISLKAFEDCVRLRNITIPISVNSIHSTAFDGCTKLNIQAEEGSVAKSFADTLLLEDIEVAEYEDTPFNTVDGLVPETDDTQDEMAEEPDYYHEVTHINPLESEEDASVKGKSRILDNQVVIFMDNAGATVNTGNADLTKYEGIVMGDTGETIAGISGNTGKKGSAFPKYAIVNDVIIADQAYYGDGRTFIEIPDTITEIGEFAFARSALTDAVIPEGVTRIGYAAFYHCDGLTNVVIPGTVTEIEPAAFANTAWIRNWEQSAGESFLIVGDGILLDYRGNDSVVVIPDGVKTIGAGAFEAETGITKVVIPDSVETIGEGAFAGCGSLTEMEGGGSVRRIKDRAFQGCPMQTIRIPASVEEIGLRAYDTADSIKAAGSGIVVFEGTSLPGLSYEESSGKLYNDTYRGLAFEGINAAVVPANVNDFEGTVLDGGLSGFRGIICHAENKEKALKICQMDPDGVSLISYPDTYRLSTVDYTLDKVQLPRTQGAGAADQGGAGSGSGTESGVLVLIDSNSIENGAPAGAVLDGADGGYLLRIADSSDAKKAIQNAYKNVYGSRTPSNLQAYEITLQEAGTSIPITGLGKQTMEITIPFPRGIGGENLHVVCLDANGQLEEADSRVVSIGGVDCIAFRAGHFSSYGIYNYISGNTAVVSNGQAVFTSASGIRDASPDTGDYSIHPKWFLGIGLFFMGLALFFYRGKRYISY